MKSPSRTRKTLITPVHPLPTVLDTFPALFRLTVPVTRLPLPVIRPASARSLHQRPATRHQLQVTRHQLPATLHHRLTHLPHLIRPRRLTHLHLTHRRLLTRPARSPPSAKHRARSRDHSNTKFSFLHQVRSAESTGTTQRRRFRLSRAVAHRLWLPRVQLGPARTTSFTDYCRRKTITCNSVHRLGRHRAHLRFISRHRPRRSTRRPHQLSTQDRLKHSTHQ